MVSARDMWTNGSGWKLQQIMGYVTERVRLRLLSVVLDDVTGATDRMSWGYSADGNFTVKSAYAYLTANNKPGPDVGKLFERIWKVVAPERVRIFLWLGMNQVIMSNVERRRRHLSSTEVCQVCRGSEETILHILRDCPAISGVWNRFVPQNKRMEFFSQSLLEWLYTNLGDHGCVRGSNWSTIFALIAWWGWKWRCMNVFGTAGKCRDRVRFIAELAQDVTRAHEGLKAGSTTAIAREERMVRWLPPSAGWLKLNTDGASQGNPGRASAGGVLRDSEGRWCGGFAVHIGICSAPLAELWGVYYGLYIAWEYGARRVVLEVDSEIVVGFLTTGISDTHPLSFLTRLCYGFISKDWIVRIVHVYREANRLADGLANYAFSLPLGFHSFITLPDCVGSIMSEDNNGPGSLRNIRL